MARRKWGSLQQIDGRPGWYVCFHYQGQKVRRKASNSRSIAIRKLKRIRKLVRREIPLDDILARVFKDRRGSDLTFRDLADLYKKRPQKRERKARTLQNEESRIDVLCWGSWSKIPVKNLRAASFRRWMDVRRRDVCVATVNRDLAMAKRILSWSVEREYCKRNPLASIAAESEKGRMRDTYLMPHECRALIEACSEEIRPVVVMAIHTGMRRGELLGLRWKDVSKDLTCITVRKDLSKSLKARSLRTNSSIQGLLRDLAKRARVVPGRSSARIFSLTPDQVRAHYDRARYSCKALSPGKRKKAVFHVLRHTAASLMRQRGVSLWDLMAIMGHGSYKMVERYAHLGPDIGLEAADKIDAVLRAPDDPRDEDDLDAVA